MSDTIVYTLTKGIGADVDIAAAGLPSADCLEKAELRARAREAQAAVAEEEAAAQEKAKATQVSAADVAGVAKNIRS